MCRQGCLLLAGACAQIGGGARTSTAMICAAPSQAMAHQFRLSSTTSGSTGKPAEESGEANQSQLPRELQETIRGIIGQSRIVVFLTGTPDEPRCRFTSALVDILRQVGVHYSFYNILEDDEVCEGLKEFSSWPTYPQVYVDGELLGGYDVTKQLLLSGELTKMLKEKNLL